MKTNRRALTLACACVALLFAAMHGCTGEQRAAPLIQATNKTTTKTTSKSTTASAGGGGAMTSSTNTGGTAGGGATGGGSGGKDVLGAQWNHHTNDSGAEQGITIATLSDGAVVVAGYFNGNFKLDSGPPHTSAGAEDVFLAVLDKDGKHLWSKRFGGLVNEYARAIAVDKADNIILVGVFDDEINFGGQTLKTAGSLDLFVAKFDKDGNHIWSRSAGGASDQEALAVAVDSSDNLLISGFFSDTIDFGASGMGGGGGASPTEMTSVDLTDIFLVKLAANGDHIWSKQFGDLGNQRADALAVDGKDNVAIGGTFDGKIDFGGGPHTNSNGDAFVAKLDQKGSYLWAQTYGGADVQAVTALAFDFNNALVVGGYFGGSMTIGKDIYASQGLEDIFVVKLEEGGTPSWTSPVAHTVGDSSNQRVKTLAINKAADIVVVGPYGGTINFGGEGDELATAGLTDMFVVKYDKDGVHKWSNSFGGGFDDIVNDLAIDGFGNILLIGSFAQEIDFGLGALTTPQGSVDAVVVKLDPGPTP